jgi:cell division protein FtsW
MSIAKNYSAADYIAMLIVLLMAIGTVFVFSAGLDIGREISLRRFYDFPVLRQIFFFPLAVLIMYAVSFFDYRKLSFAKGWLKSPAPYLLLISIALLILVLLPWFGGPVNYARRWLRISAGPATLSFQPSELAKWSIVFFLAAFCDKFAGTIKLYWKRFIPLCAIVALVTGLILVEDFGTAAFTALIAFLILIIAGVKLWHVLTLVPFGVIAFCLALFNSPARMKRIIAFLNPGKWAQDANYQVNQSLAALGSGGLFGKGLGRGVSKYGHLPEDTTDFIFAIIGEEFGLIGTTLVILLFIALISLGIIVIRRCKDPFGRLLATVIVLTITAQAAINIGVVTAVLPTKGIPLPFVSAGGTSLLLSSVAAGILLNIAKQSARQTVEVQYDQ